MRVISYGGGVQSTAMIVLATQGRIPDVDACLFANVGDDSEHPLTLCYVREVMTPWATERGLPVHELRHHRWTVYRKATETLGGVIPIRGENGAPMKRGCTQDFKVQVMERWLKERGATVDDPAESCIGISTDEYQRAGKPARPGSVQVRRYPLLELGISRDDCVTLIRAAGLPVPPKSSCWFCPFHRPHVWAEMRRDEPELFGKAVEMERVMNERYAAKGLRPMWLTSFGKPLDQAIGAAPEQLFDFTEHDMDEYGCDEGTCFI
jgi:hypothetical protein